MNLKSLNDQILLEKTDRLVREEREILSAVLHHLREIERRRLFSSLGYKSLFEMAVKKYGYSEDQAYRRISAMRLLKELPEVEEKITSGEISLTHLGIAQSFFQQEKKIQMKEMSREGKLLVLEQISKKSIREAERVTLSLSSAPEALKPDRVHLVTEDRIELKFTASQGLQNKIDRLKGLLAHPCPNLSLGELFEMLCDLALREWDPTSPAAPRKRRVIMKSQKTSSEKARSPSALISSTDSELISATPSDLIPSIPCERIPVADFGVLSASETLKTTTSGAEVTAQKRPSLPGLQRAEGISTRESPTLTKQRTFSLNHESTSASAHKRSRFIPLPVKREVFRRAESKCQNCGSVHALQVDHIRPFARGGTAHLENLRLLCRTCNQRVAIDQFGLHRMESFLS